MANYRMALNRSRQVGDYLRHLCIYVASVSLAAMIGSNYAASVGIWTSGGTLQSLFSVPFSLGPALVVVSAARLGPKGTALVAAIAAVAMLAMWTYFAHQTSATAALVFLLGPPVGIPLAAVTVVASLRRQAVELSPGPTDDPTTPSEPSPTPTV